MWYNSIAGVGNKSHHGKGGNRMSDKEYYKALSKVRTSRLNEITRAVNAKTPKAKAGLEGEVESRFYDNLWKQAMDVQKKFGDWPVFEMGEIETDDPVLDIYSA